MPLLANAPIRTGKVVIKEHMFSGANVTITPGVTICRFTVIGAGSIVTIDITAYSFASGNPTVDQRHFSTLGKANAIERLSD